MIVDAIMTTRLVSVAMDDSLEKVRTIFAAQHFHHLLVVENDHTLAGVISDRDLLKAISSGGEQERARGKAAVKKKAHQIMSRHPVVLRAGASLNDAIKQLVDNDLSCVPVVNRWGAAIGIVSWKDVLRCLHGLKTPAPGACHA